MMRPWIVGTALCLMAAVAGLDGVFAQDMFPVAGRHAVKLGAEREDIAARIRFLAL